jgi:hypothetical protein
MARRRRTWFSAWTFCGDSFVDTLRFVLVKDGEQKFILMCSDLAMTPEEIIILYARRFKIEVTFKMFKHVIGGFC